MSRTKERATAIAIALIIVGVAGLFQVGIKKNLVDTLTEQEWGRYLFGIGAALTASRWGIGGYVVDEAIEQKLQSRGLTGDRTILDSLHLKFPENLANSKLLQVALDEARSFDVTPPAPKNDPRLRGSHGDDVGIAIFTALSFRLFGFRLSSLYYSYFLVLGATLLLFILGHRQRPAAMACLAIMVLALYIIGISDICGLMRTLPPYTGTGGSDFKDPRFFGTIAAFPILHMVSLWISRKNAIGVADYVIVTAQAAILAFVIQVRWPTIWALGALCGYWLIRVMSMRDILLCRSTRSAFVLISFLFMVAIGVLATSLGAHPIYRADGDLLHHPLWHNMMTALEANPEWDTKYLGTVNGKRQDDMPAEIARQEIAKLPREEQSRYLMRMDWPSPSAIMHFARIRFSRSLEPILGS